ncbi:heme oxygenase-like protein [Tilletiopsis washingtonensis]|uniref:Heme oxygenase-like protein n=1 Tax=Tilletiopsis washingtonensis TaxID=58919 RepID=A0A316ZDD4_9BASI|nr:heme oxygenase-like protein [Tilletiopsis washingtonensis]PWN98273.1 heme oxygenase-like protein [Tilletiopsis washingtonensis]
MALTTHLLSLSASSYTHATQHLFLTRAGTGELTAEQLARWLTQDRLYALGGYVRFLGTLIAKCPVPLGGVGEKGVEGDKAEQCARRRLMVLGGAMANITREVAFFEDVAARHGLSLQTPPVSSSSDDALLGLLAPTTRAYIDFQMATVASGTFEEGLVLLWAMEVLYLESWRHVRSFLPFPSNSSSSVTSALSELIPNWTAPEFEHFVADIAELVDELPELDGRLSPQAGTNAARQRVESIWNETLFYEVRFWESAGVQ